MKQQNLKFGVRAEEIMEKNFPLLDASMRIEECVKKLENEHEGCIVFKDGYVFSVLGYEDLIKGFLERKEKEESLEKIKTRKKFKIISPETDFYKILKIMKRGHIDFLVVKDKKNVLGVITKNEIMANSILNPEIFETSEFH